MNKQRDLIRNVGAYFYPQVVAMLACAVVAGLVAGYFLCAVVDAVAAAVGR